MVSVQRKAVRWMNQNNCVIAKYLGLGTIFVWDPTEIVTKMGDNCDLYYCEVERGEITRDHVSPSSCSVGRLECGLSLLLKLHHRCEESTRQKPEQEQDVLSCFYLLWIFKLLLRARPSLPCTCCQIDKTSPPARWAAGHRRPFFSLLTSPEQWKG